MAEALAAAGTASLGNAILHVDWNQASIDSNRVCREDGAPGDYVQWNPMELAYLHDWNVVFVPDGSDFQSVVAAQRAARRLGRPFHAWQTAFEQLARARRGHRHELE